MGDRRLFLVRHGQADRSAWDGPDDQRPLTPEGIARMEASADFMTGLGMDVELILTSPLTRARQTAEIVADVLTPPGGVIEDEGLAWGFSTEVLAKILGRYAHVDRLLLTGHEPGFSTVAGQITGGSHLVCKKGSLLRIDLWSEDPPRGHLVWSIPPRALAGD